LHQQLVTLEMRLAALGMSVAARNNSDYAQRYSARGDKLTQTLTRTINTMKHLFLLLTTLALTLATRAYASFDSGTHPAFTDHL
jgi:hypothetical protein